MDLKKLYEVYGELTVESKIINTKLVEAERQIVEVLNVQRQKPQPCEHKKTEENDGLENKSA